MSADLDAVWAEMKASDAAARSEAKQRAALKHNKMVAATQFTDMKVDGGPSSKPAPKKRPSSSPSASNLDAILGLSAPSSTARASASAPTGGRSKNNVTNESVDAGSGSGAPPQSPAAIINAISRDAHFVETATGHERRSALNRILQRIVELKDVKEFTDDDYSELLKEIGKPIFKRFADEAEKCRELSLSITAVLFERASNSLGSLAYYLPALMQRVPSLGAYDAELKIFVQDIEAHEAFKRGRAVDRQDKGDSVMVHVVVELSEEIRLLAIKSLATLVHKLVTSGAASVLQPYFTEVLVFFQSQLRDPYGEIRAVVCETLCEMATCLEFETGMKFYAVGLVRSLLPVLRHKHARVRSAAVDAVRCCVMVPDRAKRRGAGTEAIQDLVGFREDNVLPVAAFYKADVQINYLAELVQDASASVREHVARMLSAFLTELEDKYDHQTRLLPYLLDLLTDDADSVSSIAMDCLEVCGKQYETDHPDEIIEKRQYGIDGDIRMNLEKPLPRPFLRRPRIGMRLYVRGNTKRFLSALFNELTNWISKTRLKSCRLLHVIMVMCEEHLAMESYVVIPMFVKALGFATQDKDVELKTALLEAIELCGRYMSPDIYVHFIAPRLQGDPSVTQFGVDAATRTAVLETLRALISGTKGNQLPQHLATLVGALVDPLVIDPESVALRSAGLDVVVTLLDSVVVGAGSSSSVAAMEAHFLATGRLANLHNTIRSLFSRLVFDLSEPSLNARASYTLMLLAHMDVAQTPAPGLAESKVDRLRDLFHKYSSEVIHDLVKNKFEFMTFDGDDEVLDLVMTEKYVVETFVTLLKCPWAIVHSQATVLRSIVKKLLTALVCMVHSGKATAHESTVELALLSLEDAVFPVAARLSDYFGVRALEKTVTPFAYHSFESFAPPSASSSLAADHHLFGAVEVLADPEVLALFVQNIFANSAPWQALRLSIQRIRIALLTMFLGVATPVPRGSEQKSSHSANTIAPLPSIRDFLPNTDEYPHASILAGAFSEYSVVPDKSNSRLNFTFIREYAGQLVENTIAPWVTPSNPLDMRTRAVDLLTIVLQKLVPEKQRKLGPFASRSSVSQSSGDVEGILALLYRGSLPDANELKSNYPAACSSSEPTLVFPGPMIQALLLNLLDDSSDEVRFGAIRAFHLYIRFLQPDQEGFEMYSSVCRSLLRHYCTSIKLDARYIVDEMDAVLRAAACLAPGLFESLLREALSEHSAKSDAVNADIVEAISGLVSHCDILAQFQK